ncbi:MAG: hypothetical protein LBQ57_10550 [Spirochaetales bacterium]|nr:hypothetical protein [Spirochaetales bacterium]
MLAVAGALISLAAAVLGTFTGAAPMNSPGCLLSFLLAAALLYYSNRTGRYRVCYIITITVVFILLFPVMFFTAGGYHSGMPAFFVFAVVFTMFLHFRLYDEQRRQLEKTREEAVRLMGGEIFVESQWGKG